MNDKGYIYTIVSLMLGLILLAVVSLHFESFRNTAELEPGKVRTDELHYFVESTKIDLSRAMEIAGRRGAIYLVDYVVSNYSNGTPVSDAQAAIAEMIVNGSVTEDGKYTNVTNMYNHTLNAWFRKIKEVGDKIGFDANTNVTSIQVYPYDAFNFLMIVEIKINITDKKGARESYCNYYKEGIKYYSIVSLDGVEDPLFPIETKNKILKHMVPGYGAGVVENIDNGTDGSGVGGGRILNLTADTDPDTNIQAFDANYSDQVPYTLFVFNVSNLEAVIDETSEAILNRSGGVINLPSGELSGGYPYVSGVPDLNLSNKSFLVLWNAEGHEIRYLGVNDDVIDRLYYSTEEGPSFFDRLEGNPNLSAKYLSLSETGRAKMHVGPEPRQGLESFVNVSEFAKYELYVWGLLDEFTNQSSVDYRYFNNSYGAPVYGAPFWFRLDGYHLNEYNLSDYAYDLNNTLVMHFDESDATTTAYSSTRSPRNGTLYGPARIDGVSNSALYFDGSDDWVDMPASLNQRPEYTVSFWVNASNTNPIYTEGIPEATYVIQINDFGGVTAGAWNIGFPGNWMWAWSSDDVIEMDAWNHVAITFTDESTTNFYVNGGYISSAAFQMEDHPLTRFAALGDNVGAQNGGSQPHSYFSGAIDEFKIWDRALTAEEIKEEYDALRQ